MNQYYEYLSFREMREDYHKILLDIEENEGEIREEIKEKFIALEKDYEAQAFRIRNIIKELEGEMASRNVEIERLQKKNDVAKKSIDSWKKLLIEVVKMKASKNSSGNYSLEAGGQTYTVAKSKSVVVDEDFNDERFTSWILKEKIYVEEYRQRIEAFMKQKLDLQDVKFEKSVNKNALKRAIDEGMVIEGVHIEENDKLIIK